VCGYGPAGRRPEPEEDRVGGRGNRKGYRGGIDPVASDLACRACIDLRSLVDLASCSGGFLREQLRRFHDDLSQKVMEGSHLLPQETSGT
jgi:hypothetical protein